MKIDRLLGIITILLQRDKVTAPDLAKRFEVSRRTIMRDIDDICMAGIPLITRQGGDGGISIADGYKLDKSVLTVDELNSIIAGLGSIGSVMDTTRVERLIARLSPAKEGVMSMRDSIFIDLSSHYKESLSDKIARIKLAIKESRLIAFQYYSAKGSERRLAEPCFITFKWSSWYVFGYCRDKCGFRLFKLNRLWDLAVTDQSFTPRDIPEEELDVGDFFNDVNKVTILFDPSVEYLLVDEYGPWSYERTDDGMLRFSAGYTNREYFRRWVLGFGEKARVIDPPDFADEIKGISKKMLDLYEHDI